MNHVYKTCYRLWNKQNVFLNSPSVPYRYVYRIEDKDGLGPFRTDPFTFRDLNWVKPNRKRKILYLRPDEDFHWFHLKGLNFWDGGRNRPNILFGLSRLSQMKEWCNREEFEKLKTLGFSLVRRKAALVIESQIQCLFLPYDETSNFYWRDTILPRKEFAKAG